MADPAIRRRIVGWGLAAHAVPQVLPVKVLAVAHPPADLAVTLAAHRLGADGPALTLLGLHAPLELDGWAAPTHLFDAAAAWKEAFFSAPCASGGVRLALASNGSPGASLGAFSDTGDDALLLQEIDGSGTFAVVQAGALIATQASTIQQELNEAQRVAERFGVRERDPALSALAPRDHCVRAFLEIKVALQLRRLAGAAQVGN